MRPQDDGLERLQQHLSRISKRLAEDFDAASEKHRGTPESVANVREQALRVTMGRLFPHPFKVAKGGIFDAGGHRSASIDCVICASNHPYLVDLEGQLEILLVDGVYAALELKPDLCDSPPNFGVGRASLPEIIRGLDQIRSVKSLARTRSSVLEMHNPSPAKRDYSTRCPSYIVAQRSKKIDQLALYVAQYYFQAGIPVEQQVDVIFVIEQGLILNNKAPDFSLTKTTPEWKPHLAVYGPDVDFNSLFYLRLVSEIGPELSVSAPVLMRFLEAMFDKHGRPRWQGVVAIETSGPTWTARPA